MQVKITSEASFSFKIKEAEIFVKKILIINIEKYPRKSIFCVFNGDLGAQRAAANQETNIH